MKNKFLAFFVLFLITLCPAAALAGPWTFGLKAGADFPVLKGADSEARVFACGGFETEYALNDMLSLQTGINYFALSFYYSVAVWDYEGHEQNLIFTIQNHFLQLPVLVKFRLPVTENKDIIAFVNIGPAFDIELGYTSNYDSALDSRYKRIGAITGIGVNYALNTGGKISFEFRSEWNINTFDTAPNMYAPSDYDANDLPVAGTIVSAMVGYIF